jgi:hypothetical protein
MAGVWYFRGDGVARLDGARTVRKALVYRPSNHVVASLAELEAALAALGWTRLPAPSLPGTLQFHRGPSSALLITLPSDFRLLKPMHLYDIVLKNRDFFEVRDLLL